MLQGDELNQAMQDLELEEVTTIKQFLTAFAATKQGTAPRLNVLKLNLFITDRGLSAKLSTWVKNHVKSLDDIAMIKTWFPPEPPPATVAPPVVEAPAAEAPAAESQLNVSGVGPFLAMLGKLLCGFLGIVGSVTIVILDALEGLIDLIGGLVGVIIKNIIEIGTDKELPVKALLAHGIFVLIGVAGFLWICTFAWSIHWAFIIVPVILLIVYAVSKKTYNHETIRATVGFIGFALVVVIVLSVVNSFGGSAITKPDTVKLPPKAGAQGGPIASSDPNKPVWPADVDKVNILVRLNCGKTSTVITEAQLWDQFLKFQNDVQKFKAWINDTMAPALRCP